jgi:hypothetical protein
MVDTRTKEEKIRYKEIKQIQAEISVHKISDFMLAKKIYKLQCENAILKRGLELLQIYSNKDCISMFEDAFLKEMGSDFDTKLRELDEINKI